MEILRLREVLKEKGMTGKDLADSVEVTPASISNIVNGNSFPKPELLKAIADTLDVDVRELFNPTKNEETDTLYVKRDGSFLKIGELKILK